MPVNQSHEPGDPQERLFDRALHELPLRRAPPTLESRVLRELQRRAALPWWRRSFGHWPLPARGAFLAICLALTWLAFIGGAAAVAGVNSLFWPRRIALVMVSAGNLAAPLAHIVPPQWLYDGVAIGAVLYAMLFGLGAALYRALYLQSTAGDQLHE
jgi:hypothetical protein